MDEVGERRVYEGERRLWGVAKGDEKERERERERETAAGCSSEKERERGGESCIAVPDPG